MNLDTYPVLSSDDLLIHHFISNGPKGPINKRIEFQEFKPYHFNLAFGDWNDKKRCLDDFVRSNNKDMVKVLATVARVVDAFIQARPDSKIRVEGSTTARSRLYQMQFVQHLQVINEKYVITGSRGRQEELFDPRKKYTSFSIVAKSVSHE